MSLHLDGGEGTEESGRRASPNRKRAPHANMSDERFEDERGLNEREMAEERELFEDERLELFLDTQHQTVLPNLPRMDGYHVCWLTTSNPRDSISWRQSIGYELVMVDDCPGWQGVGSQDGDYRGIVRVNEMVAGRIPITLYNKLMNAVGHSLPMREEEKLRAQSQALRERAEARQIQVQEGEGTADIVQRAGPMPVFTE